MSSCTSTNNNEPSPTKRVKTPEKKDSGQTDDTNQQKCDSDGVLQVSVNLDKLSVTETRPVSRGSFGNSQSSTTSQRDRHDSGARRKQFSVSSTTTSHANSNGFHDGNGGGRHHSGNHRSGHRGHYKRYNNNGYSTYSTNQRKGYNDYYGAYSHGSGNSQSQYNTIGHNSNSSRSQSLACISGQTSSTERQTYRQDNNGYHTSSGRNTHPISWSSLDDISLSNGFPVSKHFMQSGDDSSETVSTDSFGIHNYYGDHVEYFGTTYNSAFANIYNADRTTSTKDLYQHRHPTESNAEALLDNSNNDNGSEWPESFAELATTSSSSDRSDLSPVSSTEEQQTYMGIESYQTSNVVSEENSKKRSAFSTGKNKTPGYQSFAQTFNLMRKQYVNWVVNPEEIMTQFKHGEIIDMPNELLTGSKWDSFSFDLWKMFRERQQTSSMARRKLDLWKDLSERMGLRYQIPFLFPHRLGLQVVGSTLSGFATNSSDVDMCLVLDLSDEELCDQSLRGTLTNCLYDVVAVLHTMSNVMDAQVITAKVPIVRFRDTTRDLEVDINTSSYIGIRNTHLLYGYAQVDWRVKPLAVVIKLWAICQDINDPRSGSLSSYSLMLMVVHFLQYGPKKPVLPCLQSLFPRIYNNTRALTEINILEKLPKMTWVTKNKESLAELFIGFFEYYGKTFEYHKDAISVRLGTTIPIKVCVANPSPKNEYGQWRHICIEEPFDLTNTARSVFLKCVFERIHGKLYAAYKRLELKKEFKEMFTIITDSEIELMRALRERS